MKTHLFVTLAAASILTACASKPVVYKAPDSAKMDAGTKRLHDAVTSAAASHKEIQAEVQQARQAVADEGQHIEVLGPKLDDLFRIAPPELRDKIDAARQEVAAIKTANAGLAARMGSIEAKQTVHGAQIEEAQAADKQSLADKENYKVAAAQLAVKASQESVARATAENEARELKSKNWIRRALEAVAGLAIVIFGFLWFSGKLVLNTSAAAAGKVIP
jgi:chromosome segregation ATPase